MELLKEIAKDRLVIMVTHNAEIAEQYSTRIIKLLDGKIVSDSSPYSSAAEAKKSTGKRKKISMSFLTALSLSFKNLLTKKTRTILTAFAGSIGIIGIALIMSLSSGMQGYIDNLQQDTLSTYPIQLQSQSMDMSSMMGMMMSANNRGGISHDLDQVYSNNIVSQMLESMSSQISSNDLSRFKQYIETGDGKRIGDELTNSVQYGYAIELNIYSSETADGVLKVNPGSIMDQFTGGRANAMESMGGMNMLGGGVGGDVWTELIDNATLLQSQYDLLSGSWPAAYDELVLVLDENNEISDVDLYSLGILDPKEFDAKVKSLMRGEDIEDAKTAVFAYDEILSLTYKLVLNTDYYAKENEQWVSRHDDENYIRNLVDAGIPLKIVGIIKPSPEAAATSISGTVGYTSALTDYVIKAISETEIAKAQTADPETNIFTGFPFEVVEFVENLTVDEVRLMMADMAGEEAAQFQEMTQDMEDKEFLVFALTSQMEEAEATQVIEMTQDMTAEQILAMIAEQIKENADELDTYESNCELLGIVDLDNPSMISLYPKDFAAKDEIVSMIAEYNHAQEAAGHDEYMIHYTDIVGMMTSGISSIINIVSYVLIAFVAISLVVSSIMIAIITYISVMERTKEIGILRSIGASKKDITRVFNAETVIEGFVAGGLGILITLLLNVPINMVIQSLTGISGLSALPLYGAVGLIVISVCLTLIAGFIPAKMAAKKDPVVALRTE
jgi:putative ABC transport system permease protein